MSDIRFNVVTGKGGVGRTLVTILKGIESARSGNRTLLCELNTDDSIAQYLNIPSSNGQIVSVSENLYVVNIRPKLALMEYAQMKLKMPRVSKLVFDNPLVNALIRFVPGMNELLMIGKAFNHQREQDEAGKPTWDKVIIDAPATGHGITFLNLPTVIADAVPSGNMHDEAVLMQSLLTDKTKTLVDLVTTPEPLPIQETKELCHLLRTQIGAPLGNLYVNRMPQRSLSDDTFESLKKFAHSDHAIAEWLLEEEAYAQTYQARLDELLDFGLDLRLIPELEAIGYDGLTEIHIDALLKASNK